MTFVEQIRLHPIRALKSVILYISFIAVGLSAAITGPTLLDLQLAVSTSFDDISYVLPSRSGGYALGSLLIGLFYAKVNPQMVGFMCLAASTVFLVFVPWNRTLYGLIVTIFLNGVTMGMWDSGGNMMIVNLWGKENTPFMQALHFAFGLGATLAPLIAKPFLLELPDPEDTILTTTGASTLSTLSSNYSTTTLFDNDNYTRNANSTDGTITYVYTADDIQITYSYAIIGIYTGISALLFLVLFFFHRETPEHPSREVAVDEHGNATGPRINMRVKALVIIIITLFFGIYLGLELSMGTLLTPFVVKSELHLEKATGALMSSAYWLTFTFFRLFAVVYIGFGYVSAAKNIYFSLLLILISNIFLFPFGDTYEICLWIGIVLMGLGTSSLWASVFGYLEEFFPVTNGMTATFIISACTGEFILPFVIGNFMDVFPRIFLYVTLGCSIGVTITFAIVAYLCNKRLFLPPLPKDLKVVSPISVIASDGFDTIDLGTINDRDSGKASLSDGNGELNKGFDETDGSKNGNVNLNKN